VQILQFAARFTIMFCGALDR